MNSIKIAVNTAYGGFSLTREMAEWLRDNKGWTLGTFDDDYHNFDITGSNGTYFTKDDLENRGSFKSRSNPDLIECIETLQAKYELELKEIPAWKRHEYIGNLATIKVETINIEISVVDENDGKEHIVVNHFCD